MNLNGKTIVEYFLKQSKNKFPYNGTVDYKGRYNGIKNYLDINVHPLVELVVYKKDGSQLTKHGVEHIDNVIARATDLLGIEGINLTPYEIYILLVAIQIHDSGHIISGRKNHEKITPEIIKQLNNLIGDDTAERKLIFQIAEAHGGITDEGDKDKISLLKTNDRILNQPIKVQFLASILRLADELADDFTRATNAKEIEKGSEIFHKYAAALHNVEIDHNGNQINLTFCLEKENVLNKYGKLEQEVFLVDEIFERVFKTYVETIYCQRFMPYPMKLDTVFAKMEFIDKDSLLNFLPPISLNPSCSENQKMRVK